MLKIVIFVATVAAIFVAGSHRAAATDLLINGDFEQGVGGWVVPDESDTFEAVTAPVQHGLLAAKLSGTGQLSSHTVRQYANVESARTYDFRGWVLFTDEIVKQVTLGVTWLDASYQPIATFYSATPPLGNPDYQLVGTGPVHSPPLSKKALVKVEILLLPGSGFTVFMDHLAFEDVTPPATPTSTPAPTPIAVATTSRSPTPIVTPTPRPTSGSSPTPHPTRTLSPALEPSVFPQLVNGGFEQLRDDGSAFGWRKQGGAMAVTSFPRHEGSRALSFTSDSAPTKWVYQAVTVQPGSFYEATARMLNGSGIEASSVRVSWYASADGSGTVIESADSESVTGVTPDFRLASTGPVQAPAFALSAKVRLMLRPVSDEPAVAYFDAATFAETAERPPADAGPSGGESSATGNRSTAARPAIGSNPDGGTDGPILGAIATPKQLVNHKVGRSTEQTNRASPSSISDHWAMLLATTGVLGVIAIAGGYGWWRRQRMMRTKIEDR